VREDSAIAAVFERVKTPTTFEETVERLGTAIRLGILEAGMRLPSERELAEQLGISRSTLRQAITTLVQSGHLESVRGRGGGTFVVQEPPLAEGAPGPLPANWREVYDLRVALETGAGMLAAERIDAATISAMRECVARMGAAVEFEEYRRADVRFHLAIAQATAVPRLVALSTEVAGEVSELIAHIAHPEEVLAHSNAEHARIVDALDEHDVVGVVTLLRRHLGGTEHILAGLTP
jgi:DNA-binding FadR family transcriptional regulator